MIEVNTLQKQLNERKTELIRLDAMQKQEPVSQHLIDILDSLAELDEFFEMMEGPKDAPIKKKKEPNQKKSSSRLSINKEFKPSSERLESSSDEHKENNVELVDDLFMIDQPMVWQKGSDPANKRL